MPPHDFLHTMQTSISNMTGYLLKLTLYDMMCSSRDFEDVKAALNDRTDRLIELFRSSFLIVNNIHLVNDSSYFFMLSSLFFLVTAENIHLSCGRLSPAELKERAERVGYVTFALLFALLDIGFVVVRVAGFVAFSGSPALATSLILVSMSPFTISTMLVYPARLLSQRKRKSDNSEEMESGTVTTDTTGN